MTKKSFTSCPLMWCSPACTSRRRRNPLDCPTWRKRLTNPGCTDFLEVFRKTACSEGLQPNPEHSNTQQGLPDYWYILSRLLNMHGFSLWSSFAEKPLVLNPYFQYFSSNWFDSYKLGSSISLEHTWFIILSFSNIQLNISIPVSFHFFTMLWQRDQGSHIRESRRIDPI